MSDVCSFNINLLPAQALSMIIEGMPARSELLYSELKEAGEHRYIGTLVYERYFFRSSNQAALVVIVDNLQDITNVRLISAGSSNGLIMKIDWGAGQSFAAMVEKLLAPYIIE